MSSFQRVEPVEPHVYQYGGFEVMGDCRVCGHVQEDPIHIKADDSHSRPGIRDGSQDAKMIEVPEGTIPYARAWELVEHWLGCSGAPESVARSSLALAMHYDTLQQNYESLRKRLATEAAHA